MLKTNLLSLIKITAVAASLLSFAAITTGCNDEHKVLSSQNQDATTPPPGPGNDAGTNGGVDAGL